MIYTITVNPSIDYHLYLDSFSIGRTNRSNSEQTLIGGKGFNVSRMLNVLNLKSHAIGCIAGDTGRMFNSLLENSGIDYELYELNEGQTRINVKINELIETEINASGPKIPEQVIKTLVTDLSNLKSDDVLILSGSLAKNSEDNIYKRLLHAVDDDVLTIVDTSGRPLLFAIQARPFLVKPNFFELQTLYGKEITCDEDIIDAMKAFQIAGARNVLVSLGKQGACILTEDNHLYHACAKQQKVVNSVGSGDCLIAGFISTYLKTKNFKMSLITGVACGSAKAYSQDLPTPVKIKEVLASVTTKTLF